MTAIKFLATRVLLNIFRFTENASLRAKNGHRHMATRCVRSSTSRFATLVGAHLQLWLRKLLIFKCLWNHKTESWNLFHVIIFLNDKWPSASGSCFTVVKCLPRHIFLMSQSNKKSNFMSILIITDSYNNLLLLYTAHCRT